MSQGGARGARALQQTPSSYRTSAASDAPPCSNRTALGDSRGLPGPPPVGTAGQGPTRVLFVGDAQAGLLMLPQALTALGCEVTSADSSAGARVYLAQTQFDVILLDLSLMGECGRGLLAALSQLAPRTPVIAVPALAAAQGNGARQGTSASSAVTRRGGFIETARRLGLVG
jgi:CheY-like chemotaxis protein